MTLSAVESQSLILGHKTRQATQSLSLHRDISSFGNRFSSVPRMLIVSLTTVPLHVMFAVGVLSGTTGEARLLEITGIVDTNGVLLQGTHIETPQGTIIADGTDNYRITAANASPSLAGRNLLYPPSEDKPQVIYLDDEAGESALLDALAEGNIDAIARGETGNQDAAYAPGSTFVVTARDDQIEYGGFTFDLKDAELAACINERINYLIDDGKIGYAEWLQDRTVFITRAEMWNATER